MTSILSIEHDVFVAGLAAAFFVNQYHADACKSSQRRKYTVYVVQSLAEKGYNAVIVAPGWKAQGYETKREKTFDGIVYTIFAAQRAATMIVENCGAGGYENWALSGTNWVRWDKIVKFCPEWNDATMGERYETRPLDEWSGWEKVKYSDLCSPGPVSFPLFSRQLFGMSTKGDLLATPTKDDASLLDSSVYCHGLSSIVCYQDLEPVTPEQT